MRARPSLNLDDPETRMLADVVPGDKRVGYGFDSPGADFMGKNLELTAGRKHVHDHRRRRDDWTSSSTFPAATMRPMRWPPSPRLGRSASRSPMRPPRMARFEGLKRRLETVGVAAGVTVIDDFAHNPDKIDATLATLRAQPGRLLIMFQPHGYGPLTKMGEELAQSFAKGLAPDDRLFLPDPVYQGGTVDRSRGSDWLAEQIGAQAEHVADRAAIGEAAGRRSARRRPHRHHGRARRHASASSRPSWSRASAQRN